MPDLTDPAVRNAFVAAGAMGVACAVLSVVVVARRWGFLGESISHSGFGGAGTAWMLAVIFPSLFHNEQLPFLMVIVFCFIAAGVIGWLSSQKRVSSDSAIGIFLVASLAWGFVGQNVYTAHYHVSPFGFDNLLFGQMGSIGNAYAVGSVMVAAAVVTLTGLLNKEILAYCFDPLLARTSGVRTTFVHYLLMALLALTIVIGIRVVGSVLVTALLILPAASANLLSRRIERVVPISIIVSLCGAWGGLWVSATWRWLPAGSGIVLVMVLLFCLSLLVSRFGRKIA
jgi:ABC-type Mn2+/Zn2+ transport system permease subunit